MNENTDAIKDSSSIQTPTPSCFAKVSERHSNSDADADAHAIQNPLKIQASISEHQAHHFTTSFSAFDDEDMSSEMRKMIASLDFLLLPTLISLLLGLAEDKHPVKVDQGDNIPESKEATDFNTHKGERKTKIKMEGRHRLYKVSYADDDNHTTDETVALDDLEFSDLVGFDSPPLPAKNAAGIEKSQGRSEIRDILDELNSKFDILSIGKKQDPCENSSDASKSALGGVEHVEDDLDDCVEVLDHFDSENVDSITLSGPHFTYKLPGKITKMLYPHQRDGLKWLWCLHCQGKGAILGDDMGLGNTMQICSFLAGLFNSRLIKRAFVVVSPKTLLPHWIKELSVVGLLEKTRECGLLIKNPSTQRAESLLEIRSAHRIIISATSLQNNLKELWDLFNFCCPELLGDKKWFKEN